MKGNWREAIECFQKAINLQPDDVRSQNSLAWLLAASPETSLRNGGRAIQHAKIADQLTGGMVPEIKGTLAAAHAEAGYFYEAVTISKEAIRLAESEKNSALADQLRTQLRYYESGLPFRLPPQY